MSDMLYTVYGIYTRVKMDDKRDLSINGCHNCLSRSVRTKTKEIELCNKSQVSCFHEKMYQKIRKTLTVGGQSVAIYDSSFARCQLKDLITSLLHFGKSLKEATRSNVISYPCLLRLTETLLETNSLSLIEIKEISISFLLTL